MPQGSENLKFDESVEMIPYSDKHYDEMKSNDIDNMNTRSRDHLKRKAKGMKNSKYDESFLVDYSGNRSKFPRQSDLGLKAQTSSCKQADYHIGYCPKSGNTTTGKISSANQGRRL